MILVNAGEVSSCCCCAIDIHTCLDKQLVFESDNYCKGYIVVCLTSGYYQGGMYSMGSC